MKKLLSLLCVLCLLAGMVSGCSKPKSKPAAASTPGTDAGRPTESAAEPSTNSPTEEPTDLPTEEPTDPGADNPYADDPDGLHPMLFRVTGDGGQEMYLFGTMHIGDERNSRVMTALEPTLTGCDALAVEFDVIAYEQNPMAQADDMLQFILKDGSTIRDHMPEDLYARASTLLNKAGLTNGFLSTLNLAMWAQLVEQAAVTTESSLQFEQAMDRALIETAYEAKLPVRNVESAHFQYGLVASFPDELNLLLIRQTLDGLDDYGAGLNELYEAWCRGDVQKITALTEETDPDLTPEEQQLMEDYNRKMIVERNLGMRDKALEWLRAGDKVFFAVGAAHLVGDAGLISLLRQAGYSVEQVRYTDPQ